jgi:RNA-binding protein YlmH
VSSLRLDCVVSAVANLSRGAANELIEAGFVSLNSQVCEKSTRQINNGDVLTVRGKGKFIIGNTSGKTRKDRTVLEFRKYF